MTDETLNYKSITRTARAHNALRCTYARVRGTRKKFEKYTFICHPSPNVTAL